MLNIEVVATALAVAASVATVGANWTAKFPPYVIYPEIVVKSTLIDETDIPVIEVVPNPEVAGGVI